MLPETDLSGNAPLDATYDFRRILDSGERVLWQGRPQQGVIFRKADIIAIPFTCMWAGFAFFWEYEVINQKNAPFFFMLWGVPFVLFGIYILIGRFFFDAWQRGKTYYAVTDQRVILAAGKDYKSINLAGCHEMRIENTGDGRGSIQFGPEPAYGSYRKYSDMTGKPMVPTFERIYDADRVFALIRRQQKEVK